MPAHSKAVVFIFCAVVVGLGMTVADNLGSKGGTHRGREQSGDGQHDHVFH